MGTDVTGQPWFYLHPLPEAGDVADLEPEEARHATGPRRLAVGAAIVLFDGEGGVARAELAEVAPRRVRARLLDRTLLPAPRPRLHLASALPKGDRQATLLGMATQLGMNSFTPLVCERSVVRATSETPERWLRLVREACKQSRRAHLPQLAPATRPAQLALGRDAGTPIFLLHPGGASLAERLTALAGRELEAVHLLIGPEGGFSDDEIAAVQAAAGEVVQLGSGVLRTETAAVAALAVCAAILSRPA
jgi:16S rRNA (uracil1498-N3)-methyltransferase